VYVVQKVIKIKVELIEPKDVDLENKKITINLEEEVLVYLKICVCSSKSYKNKG